jgi:hypothetical protein
MTSVVPRPQGRARGIRLVPGASSGTRVIQLVYVSSALRPFTQDGLVTLLQKARARNASLGVTGLLLYRDGNFLQVLEGGDGAVRGIFRRIEADSRHADITVLLDEPITERSFPDWSMGFRNLSDPQVQALPGFSDLMNRSLRPAPLAADASGWRVLVEFFRTGR